MSPNRWRVVNRRRGRLLRQQQVVCGHWCHRPSRRPGENAERVYRLGQAINLIQSANHMYFVVAGESGHKLGVAVVEAINGQATGSLSYRFDTLIRFHETNTTNK